MKKDLLRDAQVTNSITGYLYAGYQGRFAALNILAQLGFPGVNPEEIAHTREILDRVDRWNKNILTGDVLFAASWRSAQTFDSNAALDLLFDLKAELSGVASEAKRLIATNDLPSRPDDITSLVASYARYAYSRENYLQNLIDFMRAFPEASTEQSSYQRMLEAAQDDLHTSHYFFDTLKSGAKLEQDFFQQLWERCYTLPIAFRTHMHDINQLTAPYRGGVSFETLEFTKLESDGWKAAGVGPVAAGYWRAYEIESADAAEWLKIGLNQPIRAATWKRFGFEPHTAVAWLSEGIAPPTARAWASAAFTPAQAKANLQQGITDPATAPRPRK